jgi:transcriptional regulator with XRE-family HTH domain
MVNKAKTYSSQVLETVKQIGTALQGLQQSSSISLKTLATNSGLSINSIKSIFKGSTANIASYDSLARALGSSLTKVACECYEKEASSEKVDSFSAKS